MHQIRGGFIIILPSCIRMNAWLTMIQESDYEIMRMINIKDWCIAARIKSSFL